MLSESKVLDKASKIKLLVLDVDGVLTDGSLYFSSSGEELKAFNTLDGHGLKMLHSTGVLTGIITGRTSALVERRAKDLKVDHLIQGREDKFLALQEMLSALETRIELEEVAYIGDDLPDLLVMTRVGLALTVQNGHPAVVERSHWQSQTKGGQGAVREACDMIMKAQHTYQGIIDKYTLIDA